MQICEDIFTTGDDAILSYGNHKIQVYDLKKRETYFLTTRLTVHTLLITVSSGKLFGEVAISHELFFSLKKN